MGDICEISGAGSGRTPGFVTACSVTKVMRRLRALQWAIAILFRYFRGSQMKRKYSASSCRPIIFLAAIVCACLLGACRPDAPESWKLNNVANHLPDLDFSLTADNGKPATEANFHGDIVLAYFGYTHCPDVCPETMAKLAQVVQQIGKTARHTRILFISVDPARDTPAVLRSYMQAFDARHAVGLTGSAAAIRQLAQRYRVAYQAEAPQPDGGYDVTHSSAVYIFDAAGHARLLGTEADPIDAYVHDLRQLGNESR